MQAIWMKTAFKIDILKALLDKVEGEKLDMNISDLSIIILGADLKTETKKLALSVINGRIKHSLESVSKIVFDIVCDDEILEELSESTSIEEWEEKLVSQADVYLDAFSEDYQGKIMECIVREQSKLTDDLEKYINIWHEFKRGDVC